MTRDVMASFLFALRAPNFITIVLLSEYIGPRYLTPALSLGRLAAF